MREPILWVAVLIGCSPSPGAEPADWGAAGAEQSEPMTSTGGQTTAPESTGGERSTGGSTEPAALTGGASTGGADSTGGAGTGGALIGATGGEPAAAGALIDLATGGTTPAGGFGIGGVPIGGTGGSTGGVQATEGAMATGGGPSPSAAGARGAEGELQPTWPGYWTCDHPLAVECPTGCSILESDPYNCGECGHDITAHEGTRPGELFSVCVNGVPVACPKPQVRCDFHCYDLRASEEHCGACENNCVAKGLRCLEFKLPSGGYEHRCGS